MSWTEQTHNLWIRMKRQTRGMIKFKILVDTSRNPFFCPYQFWVSHGSHGVSNKVTTPLTWSCKFLCSASFGSFSNMIFLCFSPVFLVLLVCWCLLGSIRALFPHQMPLLKTNAAWISEGSSAGFVSETQIKSASQKMIQNHYISSRFFFQFPKKHVGSCWITKRKGWALSLLDFAVTRFPTPQVGIRVFPHHCSNLWGKRLKKY